MEEGVPAPGSLPPDAIRAEDRLERPVPVAVVDRDVELHGVTLSGVDVIAERIQVEAHLDGVVGVVRAIGVGGAVHHRDRIPVGDLRGGARTRAIRGRSVIAPRPAAAEVGPAARLDRGERVLRIPPRVEVLERGRGALGGGVVLQRHEQAVEAVEHVRAADRLVGHPGAHPDLVTDREELEGRIGGVARSDSRLEEVAAARDPVVLAEMDDHRIGLGPGGLDELAVQGEGCARRARPDEVLSRRLREARHHGPDPCGEDERRDRSAFHKAPPANVVSGDRELGVGRPREGSRSPR